MHHIAVFALLTACALADDSHYSFSRSVGSGYGTSYSVIGEGRIKAVRVWEIYSNYIYGFQLHYSDSGWAPVVGYVSGEPQELELFEGERIIQVSGKYTHYIQSLIFVTSNGRSLHVGEASGHSFNMYPTHPDAELRFLSGSVSGPPTSIQAHWAIFYTEITDN
ncbi:zymogen granule membrane protein 16-like [Girardinichthys multiradiatus]|uniref:zymogen granule membrane protein 16-like n=1 Tax=Girardinichthys multiradiatus TaxID=208333 RepID=UPI001FAB97DA|nr:zymogen granule membrane protein 16-like [Girardinichthys multiradiatus]XP_047240462.1 zymogen granule membrane protein 16-like [Girardinichthys multiradiatus]